MNPDLNLVDVGILFVLAAAIVNGLRQGAALQVLSFGGFWGGLIIGAALAPYVSRMAERGVTKALTSMAVTFGTAAIMSSVGRLMGTRVWSFLKKARLGWADASLGAGVAVTASALAIWLTASVLATLPVPPIARGIQESRVITEMTDKLPPAPSIFSRLSNLFSVTGFPRVFAELEPDPGPSVAPPSDPQFRAAVAAARASTVRVVGNGCGGVQTGSGFVAASGLVVTNAHVIAGIDDPAVQDSRGTHRTTPVYFNPDLDIAVLSTTGLSGRPLSLDTRSLGRGTAGAVLGFPGGGPFEATGGTVMSEFDAVGRDIYGQDVTTRHVYQLQSQVQPGNSGGPFVLSDGKVAGVIFSRSAARESVAYAITASEVVVPLREAQAKRRADTGACAA